MPPAQSKSRLVRYPHAFLRGNALATAARFAYSICTENQKYLQEKVSRRPPNQVEYYPPFSMRPYRLRRFAPWRATARQKLQSPPYPLTYGNKPMIESNPKRILVKGMRKRLSNISAVLSNQKSDFSCWAERTNDLFSTCMSGILVWHLVSGIS